MPTRPSGCASSPLALERQLRSQRELLSITESILTTLDARAVLEQITDRIGGLIDCDNIAIEVVDPATGRLTPLMARGLHAEQYLEPWAEGETGLAPWVVEHNEPVYVSDQRHDPRVNHFREVESVDGSLIVVPLRGRSGAIGVLTIERLGAGNLFAAEEFELVQLFAAQVSIALQNAEVFRDVEIRAQTDGLTGLLNHATFGEYLERAVRDGGPFGLIMVDLDDFKGINDAPGPPGRRRLAAAHRHGPRPRWSRHRPGLPLRRRRVRLPAAGDRWRGHAERGRASPRGGRRGRRRGHRVDRHVDLPG